MAAGVPRLTPGGDRLPQGGSDLGLSRRYRWVLFFIGLPLFVLVVALAANEYRYQRAQILADMVQTSTTHASALGAIAQRANDHVLRMQDWTADYFTDRRERPSRLRPYLAARTAEGESDGFALDDVPAEQRSSAGQVLWFGSDPLATAEQRRRLDHALDLASLVSLTHASTSTFRWSYFLSAHRDHVSLYPWVGSRDVIEGLGHSSLKQAMPGYFAYEIYAKGLPERNPDRHLYWTEPYMDAGGTGAMVSVGAPVYLRDAFIGVVGTDVTLETLDRFLAELPRKGGRFWIADDSGMLLADSSATPRKAIEQAAASLPAGWTLADVEGARSRDGQPYQRAGYILIARRAAYAPWSLLYMVSEREVQRMLLPHFLLYGILLIALGAAFALGLSLLQREFVTWARIVARTSAAHRQARQELKASEAFKSAIIDNAMLAVITIDVEGRIVEFNPAAQVIFGHRLEDAKGRDMADLIMPERLRAPHRRGLQSYRDKGALRLLGRRLEVPALRADGTEFPIALSISVTEVGHQRYFTAFISDLTEQKRATEELARQREALRQSEKLSAMGSLLAGIAHELNNPLAILLARAALLARKVSDAAALADVDKIRAAAERCGRIVKTFLSMARQRPADRRPAQLNDIVAGALDLVNYSWRTAGIAVRAGLTRHLPEVGMDADQIGQVVVNLLINAQQAVAERPQPRVIRVETGQARDGDKEGVYLRVADNAAGVPAHLRARIFEPFFTTKPEGMGTGVGLSVSRSLARENGGELRLEETTHGASFRLWLPLNREAAQPAPPRAAPLPDDERVGHALIVDDEPEVALALAEILQSAGLTTTRIGSGREALEWLATGHCDFLLSDMRMPDLDGAELWRTLRDRHPELARRMAFVTGDTLAPNATRFLNETGPPWLEKPFTPEQVLALIARIEAP